MVKFTTSMRDDLKQAIQVAIKAEKKNDNEFLGDIY